MKGGWGSVYLNENRVVQYFPYGRVGSSKDNGQACTGTEVAFVEDLIEHRLPSSTAGAGYTICHSIAVCTNLYHSVAIVLRRRHETVYLQVNKARPKNFHIAAYDRGRKARH